jgi:hypothetical protein
VPLDLTVVAAIVRRLFEKLSRVQAVSEQGAVTIIPPDRRSNGWGGARAGAGRKPGIANQLNGDVKAMLLESLEQAGGVDYLVTQAYLNPGPYLALIGKVLPMTVQGNVNINVGFTRRIV